MKKILRNILILLTPYLFMVLVNERVRPTIKNPGFTSVSINTAMNPELKHHDDNCSWRCHNVECSPKLLKPFESQISPLYDGLIDFLKKSGDYKLANILFLVLLWPLVMFYLLIKSLDMQQEIKKLKI